MIPMIITNHGRFNVDQFIEFLFWSCWAFFCLVICAILLFCFWPHSEKIVAMNENLLFKSDVKVDYACIGTGPLALAGVYMSPLASTLSHEIVLLVPSSRPKESGAQQILLGLKNNQEHLSVSSGEKIYLQEENPHQLQFSSTLSQIWLKPVVLDCFSVLIEAEIEGKDHCEFVLKAHLGPLQTAAEKAPFYAHLKKAKWWGQDLLLQTYGGNEYRHLKDKQKIECGPSMLYVSQDDYLTFAEGIWKVTTLEEASLSSPLAQVKEVASNQLKLIVWDEKGFAYDEIKLPLEARLKAASQQEIFSSIRFRTSAQVTCLLGKRRVILKCGDWLLKTATGWRNLKRLNEIEAYLAHELRGELFIFDAIEKREDKYFVKGNLIDEMRTSISNLSLPIVSEKKTKPSKKKKKSWL